MTDIIDKIFNENCFKQRPPILIDIGASGHLNRKWSSFAKYCICICFDPDDREFMVSENVKSDYLKLYVINRAVISGDQSKTSLFLTHSPYCSSTLKPLTTKLDNWLFRDFFSIEKEVQVPSIRLSNLLKELSLDYIDWLKIDTQGTDLRIFTSLPMELRQNIVALEMEPGIIDAYEGEDKMWNILKTLPTEGYWASSISILGTKRLNPDYISGNKIPNTQFSLPDSPCWAEMLYFKEIKNVEDRSLLLLYVFAVKEFQYGFALEVCTALRDYKNQALIKEMQTYCISKMVSPPNRPQTFKNRVINFLIRFLKKI